MDDKYKIDGMSNKCAQREFESPFLSIFHFLGQLPEAD
jgi:hypothetical protein